MGEGDRGQFSDEAFDISKSYFLAHPIQSMVFPFYATINTFNFRLSLWPIVCAKPFCNPFFRVYNILSRGIRGPSRNSAMLANSPDDINCTRG